MADLSTLPKVVPGAESGAAALERAGVQPCIPDPLRPMSAKQRKVWDHVTGALLSYGLIHRTDSMVIDVICATYLDWVETRALLDKYKKEHDGNYFVVTPNGYEQPHQSFFAERRLKKELLQWLPEAALTIPSFQDLVGNAQAPDQPGLFDDPVEAHRKRKAGLLSVVQGGGK